MFTPTRTCPTSPALKWLPRICLPFITVPTAMPVPTFTYMKFLEICPNPQTRSALVALFTSLSICTIQTGQGPFTLRLGGTIDRMDAKESTLRIVDYKTGGSPKIPANIEQLFTPSETRPNYIFQTFLYAAIMSRQQSLMVAPALLYIHRAASENYSPVIEMGEPRKPKIPVNNFAFFEDEFRERLQTLLEEIFSEEEPFTQTEDTKKCSYCDFKAICKR